MKVLGVITARGVSKRLPNKNTAMLGGKPLIAWSIEVGKKACDHLALSTDSELLAGVTHRHGYAYVMPPERSLDIDTHADFEAARAMLDDEWRFDPRAIVKKVTAQA